MEERIGLSELTEEQRQQAMERFHILRPFFEEGVPLTRIARIQSIPIRTLRRWVHLFRKHGLVGLARKRRSDRGKRRIPAEMVQLIEGLALQKPAPSVAAIHRRIGAVAKDQGWDMPSYGCVYDIIRRMDPALVTLAQQGTKRYREVFDMIHRREAERPNEIWQADHTLLDIWVFNEQDKPARPWLTVIIDDYSRSVAGYYLSFQRPSAMQTALALHQAIWRKDDSRWHICGIPEVLYTDHGSDFTSRHMEQVCADLKIRLVFSTPGVPRGRGRIERFFQTVNQMFLSQLPGYISSHHTSSETKLTLPELDERFRTFLLEEYHHSPHGGTGITPQERWEADGFLPRLPDSVEELDLLLLTVAKTRRVHPDGIRFQGYRYVDPILAAYIGEDVTIRYDPRDLAEIRIFFREQFLCRAICPELSDRKVDLKEIVQARNRRRRELSKTIRDRSQLVDTYLSVHQTAASAELKAEDFTPSSERQQAKSRLKRYRNE